MTGLPGLRVDTGEIAESSNALKLIAIDFAGGDTVIHRLIDAVGHGQGTHNLRHEISAFSSSWDARRERMRDKIEELQGITEMVAREFDNVDSTLASQITVTSSAPATTTPPNRGMI